MEEFAHMLHQGIVLSEKHLQECVNYFLSQDHFYFDVETTGINRISPTVAPVTWLSLATTGCCVVIPLGHETGEFSHEEKVPTQYKTGKNAGKYYNKTTKIYGKAPEQLDAGTVFSITKPLFESTSIRKGGHDVLFDLVAVSKYLGFVPPPPYDDSKIGYWLLDENDRQGSYLKNMVENRYDHKYDDEGIGSCVESYPFSTVAYYSYCDSKFGHLCMGEIRKRLEQEGLMNLYDIEMSVLNVMIGMKLAGARIDMPRLKELKPKLEQQLLEAEMDIYRAADQKFNVNSNKQKAEILYGSRESGGQALRPWKLTTGGKKKKKLGQSLTIYDYSTDHDVLEGFDNPVAKSLTDYNAVHKVLTGYVNSWMGSETEPSQIFNEHIHAGFQQYGTVTGRFSCRAPNLQNIPRPFSDLGRSIKELFIAEEGGKLVCADYSQMELVVLAHYIGHGALYDGFLAGTDPHALTAAMVLEKDISEVTKVERQDLGKTLGFAVVYGAGIGKISSMAHTSWDETKRILKMHEKMFPEIHEFKQQVIDLARSRKPVPTISTLLGRRRRIPELNSRDDDIRMGAERQMFNSLIQGGLADLTKLAMIRLDAQLPPEANLILTVHDELTVACPEYMTTEVEHIMEDAMIGPGIQKLLRVPMKIEMHTVDRWSETK